MANTNISSKLQFVATVTTGFEKIALGEVKDAGFQAIGFRDGVIFFQTSDLALPKVLSLRCVNHISLLLHRSVITLQPDKASAFPELRRLFFEQPWHAHVELIERLLPDRYPRGFLRIPSPLLDPSASTSQSLSPSPLPLPPVQPAPPPPPSTDSPSTASAPTPAPSIAPFPAPSTSPSFRVTGRRSGPSHTFSSVEAAAFVGALVNDSFGWRVDLTHYAVELELDIRERLPAGREHTSFPPPGSLAAIAACEEACNSEAERSEVDATAAAAATAEELEKLGLDEDSEARIRRHTMNAPNGHRKPGPAVSENDVWLSLSITDTSLHRRNLRHGGPTTLKSTIAACMLRLLEIRPGAVVCDPMCGTGSIPIEGALTYPGALFLAGDNHPVAARRALLNTRESRRRLKRESKATNRAIRDNSGSCASASAETAASRARSESACSSSSGDDTAAGVFSSEPPNCSSQEAVSTDSSVPSHRALTLKQLGNVCVFRWDVTALPLPNDSVDAFITDLPFGRRMGNRKENPVLYHLALGEMARALRAGGRACLLTAHSSPLNHALQRQHAWWKLARMHRINHGGLEARVYLLTRTREPHRALAPDLPGPGSGTVSGTGRLGAGAGRDEEGGDGDGDTRAMADCKPPPRRFNKPRGARKLPNPRK